MENVKKVGRPPNSKNRTYIMVPVKLLQVFHSDTLIPIEKRVANLLIKLSENPHMIKNFDAILAEKQEEKPKIDFSIEEV